MFCFNFGISLAVLLHELYGFYTMFFLLKTIPHVLHTKFLASRNVTVLMSSSFTKTSFGGRSGKPVAEIISDFLSVNSLVTSSTKTSAFS